MTMTLQELGEQIEQTVTIPTVPTTLFEIDKIVNDPDGSAAAAAEVIAKDPAIASKVLRLANSSIYGLKSQVCDIPHAVSILGLRVLRNLVVQATILEEFGDKGEGVDGFDLDHLWDHSVKVGVAAKQLARMSPVDFDLDEEVAYTAGLLHDIGKILLIENAPETVQRRRCRSRAIVVCTYSTPSTRSSTTRMPRSARSSPRPGACTAACATGFSTTTSRARTPIPGRSAASSTSPTASRTRSASASRTVDTNSAPRRSRSCT